MKIEGKDSGKKKSTGLRMSEVMKVEAYETGGLRMETPIPAASTSELEHNEDKKDLNVHMMGAKEEVPHDWSSSLDQQNSNTAHIKVEEEELSIYLKEEQLTVKSIWVL
ncbi:uncharacterized protein LOC129367847 isoform X2 [Poeciliopsis prolifica]|uniref:uncharacterized protein LOC129367847 isoform X2 n=1 Tax=Poeciliopsis prolifica TaxID=188132 RepID=UPI0024136A55|nr:uncharacterized protein LOC129367847 isoform X2 [Poeciliopsis prolifica]